MDSISEGFFSTGDRADDLIDWTGKLIGLGTAVTGLGYMARNENSAHLITSAEAIGGAIVDYAQAIQHVVEGAYFAIGKYFDTYPDNPAGRLKEKYDRIIKDCRKNKSKFNADRLTELCNEVEDIIQEVKPFYGIREILCGLVTPDQDDDDIEEVVNVELDEAS